ncbi:hypothetical protein IAU60_005795 [Kwoniella sp. DSM 27419]
MERLFRKPAGRRTPSDSSHPPSDSSPDKSTGFTLGCEDGVDMRTGDKAPSLDVDIRNSLILPALSKRFSVLLPSLSTAPEQSLRSLLASQRARHGGPALTLEEEELLFAEIRDAAQDQDENRARAQDAWDGRPPPLRGDWPTRNCGRAGAMSHSASSPSFLSSSTSARAMSDVAREGSPPPNSLSFESFKTFGVGTSPEQPAQLSHSGPSAFKTKSYGFSGGSALREADYLRRVKQSTGTRHAKGGSTSSRKGALYRVGGAMEEEPESGPTTTQDAEEIGEKSTVSEQGADTMELSNSTSFGAPALARRGGHKSSASVPSLPSSMPPTPTSPDSGTFAKQQRAQKRQSRLAGLTPAQVKRISLALEEIGGELTRGSTVVPPVPEEETTGFDDVEEILDGYGNDSDAKSIDVTEEEPENASRGELIRRSSDMRSEASHTSAASSVFPFKMTPTNSPFDRTVPKATSTAEPGSPTPTPSSKLPPSPKSYNLLAHVEEPPPIPIPIFTPTRSQPVRHQPSLSTSSTATQTSPQAVYVPGQPRPIRLTHDSQSSTSSRSATPIAQSPRVHDDSRSSTVSPEHSQDQPVRQLDRSLSPIKSNPLIAPRGTSLGRSQSVKHTQGVPSRPTVLGVFDQDTSQFNGNRPRAGTVGQIPSGVSLNSPLGQLPPTPDTIEEAEEGDIEQDVGDSRSSETNVRYDEHALPELKRVVDRHSVARSRRTESEASIHQIQQALGWTLSSGHDTRERTVSLQGTLPSKTSSVPSSIADIDDYIETSFDRPGTSSGTLSRRATSDSLGSSFREDDGGVSSEARWTNVFEFSRPDSCEPGTGAQTPDTKVGIANHQESVEMFRKLSGMGIGDLALLQDKLVSKAKQEREALRGEYGHSPVVAYTPPTASAPFSTASRTVSPHLSRPISPSTAWKFPPIDVQPFKSHSSTPSHSKATLPSSSDTHIMTPPSTAGAAGVEHARVDSATTAAASELVDTPVPSLPTQLTPVETPSEMADETIYTPQTADLSRKPSARMHPRKPLEEDPDVRRDFEARIAAATAALHRTPSTGPATRNDSGVKLERKFTKKGGAMIISSPKLVSSTASVPTTPLTPSEQESGSPPVAVEKLSGVKKIGMWRKLTGRKPKGQSMSASDAAPFPSPQLTSSSSKAPAASVSKHAQTQSEIPQGPSQSAQPAPELDLPIKLRAGDKPITPGTAPPDLNAFRFPSQERTAALSSLSEPEQTSPPASGLKHALSKMRKRDDKQASPPVPDNAFPRAISPPVPAGSKRAPSPLPSVDAVAQNDKDEIHDSSRSDEDAITKFVEAGRQLGLTEEQIQTMLAAKGMTMRSASGSSSVPYAPTGAAEPIPSPDPASEVKEEHKERKGLFRSLSRSRKNANTTPTLAPSALISDPIPVASPRAVHDKVIVRRTMILPEGLNIIPSTPQLPTGEAMPSDPSTPDGEGNLAVLAQSQGRKQSIRRKPINLSEEDQKLVSNSPPAHQRSFSSQQSSRSASAGTADQAMLPSSGIASSPAPVAELHGLGFLHPNTPLRHKTSSHLSNSPGGSFDDDSHARSSTGGSLIDMYANYEDDGEELLQSSPTKRGAFGFTRDEMAFKRQTQAVEITEYADGQVVWNIVDALRDPAANEQDAGVAEMDDIKYDSIDPHSRTTSYSSAGPREGDVEGVHARAGSAGWPRGMSAFSAGTQGLNFRHRDRNASARPRPPTDIYFTSSRDVADLIDHLSRDLDASKGRIEFSTHSRSPSQRPWPIAQSSPFMLHEGDAEDRRGGTPSPASQFEDAPSPAPVRRAPPARIVAPPAGSLPAGGFSPKRQLLVKQAFGPTHSRSESQSSVGNGTAGGLSPSAKSFASSAYSSQAEGGQRSVEDRLQALLDRLKDGAAARA